MRVVDPKNTIEIKAQQMNLTIYQIQMNRGLLKSKTGLKKLPKTKHAEIQNR